MSLWSREELLARLATFTPARWPGQPVSPLLCARRGWRLEVSPQQGRWLRCAACGGSVSGRLPPPTDRQLYAACVRRLRERLSSGHRPGCRWSLCVFPAAQLRTNRPDSQPALQQLLQQARRLAAARLPLPPSPAQLTDRLQDCTTRLRQRLASPETETDPDTEVSVYYVVAGWELHEDGVHLACSFGCRVWDVTRTSAQLARLQTTDGDISEPAAERSGTPLLPTKEHSCADVTEHGAENEDTSEHGDAHPCADTIEHGTQDTDTTEHRDHSSTDTTENGAQNTGTAESREKHPRTDAAEHGAENTYAFEHRDRLPSVDATSHDAKNADASEEVEERSSGGGAEDGTGDVNAPDSGKVLSSTDTVECDTKYPSPDTALHKDKHPHTDGAEHRGDLSEDTSQVGGERLNTTDSECSSDSANPVQVDDVYLGAGSPPDSTRLHAAVSEDRDSEVEYDSDASTLPRPAGSDQGGVWPELEEVSVEGSVTPPGPVASAEGTKPNRAVTSSDTLPRESGESSDHRVDESESRQACPESDEQKTKSNVDVVSDEQDIDKVRAPEVSSEADVHQEMSDETNGQQTSDKAVSAEVARQDAQEDTSDIQQDSSSTMENPSDIQTDSSGPRHDSAATKDDPNGDHVEHDGDRLESKATQSAPSGTQHDIDTTQTAIAVTTAGKRRVSTDDRSAGAPESKRRRWQLPLLGVGPLRAHRSWCPWVTGVDGGPPGWQLAVEALKHTLQLDTEHGQIEPRGNTAAGWNHEAPMESMRHVWRTLDSWVTPPRRVS